MATTTQVRNWWHLQRCSYGVVVPAGFFGRSPVWSQEIDFVTALEAAHLGSGYVPTDGGFIGSKRSCPKGIGGKDCQPSGKNCSLHNYGIAWDIEYNYNPHFRHRITDDELRILHDQDKTKYTPEIADSILTVTNIQGDRLFRWLGRDLGDTMHWQIDVPPERAVVDWTSVPGDGAAPPPPQQGGIVYLPLVYSDGFTTNPDRRDDVEWLQRALIRAGFNPNGIDGKYGNDTASAVKNLTAAGDGRVYGPAQHDDLLDKAYGGSDSVAPKPHSHKYSGTTTEAT